ncbi:MULTISPECIES: hypothetical protein [Burkholderia]|uniref:hypothetical protein n=1 Tax=Burkholderia TaxID=32008 RepID=UPI000328062B|nr:MULTISPECIES: hypothetical protein [Burkholderia]AGK51594.1 hypothetical protein BTI_5783 [Burkholderia thailandensis MSMB121]ATF32830.1 hypothetical protein CO709_05210 [Burkholderia thailandensis]
MKQTLIAVALALAATSAYCVDRNSVGDAQSSMQTPNDHTQTAISPKQATPSKGNPAEEAGAQQGPGHWVDSWSELGNGWKQFGEAKK